MRAENLPPDQRYQLALRLLQDRAGRFRTTALLGAGTAVLLARLRESLERE